MRAKAQVTMRKPAAVSPAPGHQSAASRQSKDTVAEGWKPGEVDTRQVQDDDPMVSLFGDWQHLLVKSRGMPYTLQLFLSKQLFSPFFHLLGVFWQVV